MSGLVLIYNKSGAEASCSRAAYEKIRAQIDERSYRVQYISEAPEAINDTHSNPVRLFVIPGGNYTQMSSELKLLGPRIRSLIVEDGASYLGLCAGAIAACSQPLLFPDYPITKEIPKEKNEMFEFENMQMHLNLYSGRSCFFDVPRYGLIGTQEVRRVASDADQKPFRLFFSRGVFFPDARRLPDATALLEYSRYRFTGQHGSKNNFGTSVQYFYNEAPVAAVAQKVGHGTLVLSGLHPELDEADVAGFTGLPPQDRAVQGKTCRALSVTQAGQTETLRTYLETLSIATKKV